MESGAAQAGSQVPLDPLRLELTWRPCAGEGGQPGSDAGAQGPCLETVSARFSLESLRDGACEQLVLECGAGALDVAFDGESFEVALRARAKLSLEACRVVFRHAFAAGERVLLNGYQSWTDTAERPAWSSMRGLRGVPKRLVKRYALDGSGDYSFVDYTGRPGCQHGFTYATFRRGEHMTLTASLDEAQGFTLIQTDAAHGEVVLSTEVPARPLDAGERVVLGRYAIVGGSQERCFDRWFELAGLRARPAKPLVGYTSWYRHYGAIDERKLAADLQGAADFFAGLDDGHEGALRRLFQIDDGYCKVGDWLDVDRDAFPEGLAPLARRIADAGFMPGLWIAPFVCEKDSRLFHERSDWLLRDDAGDPVRTGSHWSGGYALDVRNVEVRSYVLDVLATITRDWGFGLLKVDFLYAACMGVHDGLNRGQLMADACRLLRKGVGEDVALLGCGVPLASAFGVFDYCRVGCDVGLDWDDTPPMRLLHRERVSTKNSLGNTIARAALDGRAFGLDPDVFFLRRDVRLTAAQRARLLDTDARLGSVLLTSDDMGEWTQDMRAAFADALRTLAARVRVRADEAGE